MPAAVPDIAEVKVEICILAGGLSTRMGRDKAKVRLGGRTMLSIVRDTASSLEVPVRVIRKDIVPRCGPLGGLVTGLQRTHAEAVLFLACDMPLVTSTLLRRIVRASDRGRRGVFAVQRDRVGFPLLLPRWRIADVQSQIAEGRLSIHQLAQTVDAQFVRVAARSAELFNINTPENAERAVSLVTPAIRSYGSPNEKLAGCSLASESRRRRQRSR